MYAATANSSRAAHSYWHLAPAILALGYPWYSRVSMRRPLSTIRLRTLVALALGKITVMPPMRFVSRLVCAYTATRIRITNFCAINRSLTRLRRTTGSDLAAAGNIDTLHDGRTLEEYLERPHDVRKIGDADEIARLVKAH
jgi:hypothetical protein